MNDHTVGRIDHAMHDHPQTSWYRKLCRDSMIQNGQPYVNSVRVNLPAGSPLGDHLLRREAEASVALDHDEEVGTYAVESGHDEAPAHMAPRLNRKPFFMPMDQIVELDEMLARLNEVLDGYAITKSAVIRFDKDGLELAVIWNGQAWGVQVGD